MKTPEQILKQYWGYDKFRPLQREIIESILNNTDTMALLPTGGGKSVCFQVPALLKEGLCIVISPLIALMQDQVARLKDIGVEAETVHSGLNYNQVKQIFNNAINGGYKLLYMSPERLQTQLFLDYLPDLDLSMIAIDEAHCISQWGHDFRPSYLKISVIKEYFPDVPFLALTATATTDVKNDIVEQLKMNNPVFFKQSFVRKNIFMHVNYTENKNTDTEHSLNKDCAIVYCRSRKQTEMLSSYLSNTGLKVHAYHAGKTKEYRDDVQQSWMKDEVNVMVATTAFGMGIDKPDVRTVVHYDAPEHLESYYQEIGRAGRDGKQSYAFAFYNSIDIDRLIESTALQFPPETYLRQVYQAVADYLQIPIGCEPNKYYNFDIFDFCRKFSLLPNNAIHALKLLERENLWTLTESVYSPSTIKFLVDRQVLDDLYRFNRNLEYVTVGLLRMYNSLFYFPTPVRESAICKHLKIKLDELMPILLQLHNMKIIEYNKPSEGPQMFFHHYRVDSRYLQINLKHINMLRKRHEVRTKAMLDFLENETQCREKLILNYFDEKAVENCGRCDICVRNKKENIDITSSLRNQLIELLKTKQQLSILQTVQKFPTNTKEQIVDIIRNLVDDGYIDIIGNSIIRLNAK